MSLLEESMEECVMLDKRIVSDGYGGYTSQYFEGVPFDAACPIMSSNEVIAAQASGSLAKYHVITKKGMNLQYHDVFRRLSDGKIFRVTSDGDDNKTPQSAGLNMRSVDAEEWTLPTNG